MLKSAHLEEIQRQIHSWQTLGSIDLENYKETGSSYLIPRPKSLEIQENSCHPIMLHKLFGARTRTPKPPHGCHIPSKLAPNKVEEGSSSVLKIIHAGGNAECYYMAVPAVRIIEKYPSYILARPEIFRRPWDSVVRPEEILIPGQKFFIVPRGTVKKLRQRIRKPSGKFFGNSFESKASTDVSVEIVSHQDDLSSSKSFKSSINISTKSNVKIKIRTRRVHFFGIDSKMDKDSVSLEKENSEDDQEKTSRSLPDTRKRRVRNAVTWQPKLTVINETQGSEE
ncbi:unnamed protein product [Ilex paraguariensis]|uniref:Uncharacterized protein n=1 Tax=Ilex paraguariensis TaxID=185542 RepID=A0ABC8TCV1_9AQUA